MSCCVGESQRPLWPQGSAREDGKWELCVGAGAGERGRRDEPLVLPHRGEEWEER